MDIQDLIREIESSLPPFATPVDLVNTRLYGCLKTAANERAAGRGPAFLKIGPRRVVYPRRAVIDWIKKSAQVRDL